MTRVFHDLGEAGSSEENGIEKKWLIVPAFKKYIVIHSFILSLHLMIAYCVVARGRRVKEREREPEAEEWKLSSLPCIIEASISVIPMSVYFSTASSPVYHTWVTSVQVRIFFLIFQDFLSLHLRLLILLLISVIKNVAAFHTPASSHVLSHNKPVIFSVSIL